MLGSAQAGQKPQLDVKLEEGDLIRSYLARAIDSRGNEWISKPMHVLVIDPALDTRIRKQMAAYDAPISSEIPAGGARMVADPSVKAAPDALIAYGLTAAQEEAFGSGNTKASSFWNASAFAAPGAALTARNHAPHADVDASDQTVLSARAAYSRKGLYLLFVLEDKRQEGGMDFHLSREARIDKEDLITWNRTWKRDSCQYHVAFGGKTLMRNIPTPFMIRSMELSLEEATRRYGIVIRHVQYDGKDAQEWLLPWSYVGKPAGFAQPQPGTALGIELGFNGSGDASKLRWPRAMDVWAARFDKDGPNPWGSLILGPRLRQ